MPRAFVAIGSNINPAENVRKALRLLAHEVRLVEISTVYRTDPEGRPEQSPYYNCVIGIETDVPPKELKHRILRRIEEELGRRRSEDQYAPRTIDLDLVLYGDLNFKTEDLTLPDPEILHRPFLAIPLGELVPDLTLAGSGLPIGEVAAKLSREGMEALDRYTESLKEEARHGFKHGED
jgi:2-amino-4-hydroxy-6-hydroxymethyldihydropteridine diphosphokinase